jgi:hypothetical protein
MSAGNLIFLLLIIGGVFAMFSMHRGGHAHGGMGGGGGGHGGHSHGGDQGHEAEHDRNASEEEKKPLLGPPGTGGNTPTPAAAGGHRHRGC